jgi:hypothetical protein
LSSQPRQNGRANEAFLRLADVVLSLRLDDRLFNQDNRLTPFDFLDSGLDQPIGHVFEHHRLQGEGCSAVAGLHQRAQPQRLDGLDDGAPTDVRRHVVRQLIGS